ncbi:MAG: hypothetical protein ACRDT4_05705 [Micromonosporaceae bacterium]
MEPNDLIKNFHQRKPTPERQAITHVSLALTQVRDLPQYAAHDAAVDPTVRIACLEAFYVSVRLLAEFFVRKPAGKHEDYTAWSFLPSWQPAPEDAAGRLGEQWTIASQQVMHLSKKRIQEDVNNPRHEDTSEDGLRKIAADCDAVLRSFTEAYEADTARYVEGFRRLVEAFESGPGN